MQLVEPRLHARREIVDLHAGVVVIELARHLPAGDFEERGNRIAERRLTTVTDVQGTRRICGDELDVDDATSSNGIAAVLLVGGNYLAQT